jgi:beta-N-acetylhexosaminidase
MVKRYGGRAARGAGVAAVCLSLVVACSTTTSEVSQRTTVDRSDRVASWTAGAASLGRWSPGRVSRSARSPDRIERRIAAMTLRDKIRQLLVLAYGGTRAPTDLIRRFHPGGLISFSDNLVSDGQIRAMNSRSQRVARHTGQPLLLMTDQEGGPVTRLPGTQGVPGGVEFHGNAQWARRTALHTGRTMRSLGLNVDLAPVADVNTVGHRGVIGDRSFSSHPYVAARLVRAQVCGYHQGRVAATAKHFPGHGSTTTDSHLRPARIRESKRVWRHTDLPPFARAVRAGVDMIMVGHLSFPAMDRTGRPATISPLLDKRLLRHDLGFRGVVITDALTMRGITAYGSAGSIAVRAIRSGVDLLLMTPRPALAVRGIAAAVHQGKLGVGRINASVRRILVLKQRLGLYRASEHLERCR